VKLLREYITKIIIAEATRLPHEYFSAIDDAITLSRFWEKPNSRDDIDYYDSPAGGSNSTPAAETLRVALQNVLHEIGLDVDVAMSSFETDDKDLMLHPNHPAYPNRWLIDARWYISKQKPGQSTIDLELMTSEEKISALNPAALVSHITHSVRHELVHYYQMKKQAKSKDISEEEAFQEMIKDPRQVPDRNNQKYWRIYEPTGKFDKDGEEIINRSGFKRDLHTQDYLHSHIEIDAHAHDGAEDLLDVYGSTGAFEQLTAGFDLLDPELPNAIGHYFEYLSADDPTLNKFRSKLYNYLMHFTKKNETISRGC